MRFLIAIAAIAITTPAAAKVVSASPSGFDVQETVSLRVSAHAAYDAFAHVGSWWDPQHTYSGDSSNLHLTLVPGGCFCERIPKTGGGIEHLRVTYLEPSKTIVMTGALGPLLYEAVNGVMNVGLRDVAGGSQVTLDYKASGFATGGADKLAAAVDQVLSTQMQRFRAYANARPRP